MPDRIYILISKLITSLSKTYQLVNYVNIFILKGIFDSNLKKLMRQLITVAVNFMQEVSKTFFNLLVVIRTNTF